MVLEKDERSTVIMDDMERYGDYNDIDEPKGKSPVGLIIKIIAALLCVTVIGTLAFRIISFNYYPESMKRLYFDETLTEHYRATDGNIGALSQKLRFEYDDEAEGYFFCSNVIVVREAGQLQLSLRYNVSLADAIREKYSLAELPENLLDCFSFKLRRSGEGQLGETGVPLSATVTPVACESFLMYRYVKLVINGIDFGEESSEEKINWIRLEVYIDGAPDGELFSGNLIYENNDQYSKFSDYALSDTEVPKL